MQAAGTLGSRQGRQKPRHMHPGTVRGANAHERGRQVSPQQVCDAAPEVAGSGRIEHGAPIPQQHKAHGGESQGMQQSLVLRMGRLRVIALQKTPADGRVEEKIADLDNRARRTAGAHGRREISALAANRRALHILRAPRGDAHVRHGRNTRQGFSSETELRHSAQIIITTELAGSMPLQAQRSILSPHAAAVIAHLDERDTAAPDFDAHAGGTGIDTVFHQLLDDRGGTLHDLPGRHLAGQHIIHAVNPRCILLRIHCRRPLYPKKRPVSTRRRPKRRRAIRLCPPLCLIPASLQAIIPAYAMGRPIHEYL